MNSSPENIEKRPITVKALTAIYVIRITIILLIIATSDEVLFIIGLWLIPLTLLSLSLFCIFKHKYNLLMILICLHAITNLTQILSLIFDVVALSIAMSNSAKLYFKKRNPRIILMDEEEAF